MYLMEDNSNKLLAVQKKAIRLRLDSYQKTNLVAVFVDIESYKNNTIKCVPCLSGVAISGYAYDCTNDSYIMDCVGHCDLGLIPFCCYLKVNDSYEIRIPLADHTCRKIMSFDQKSILKKYVNSMDFKNHSIVFLQTICD